MTDALLLRSCRPYRADAGAPPVDVVVRGGTIEAIGATADAAGLPVLDAGGRTLIPGLIDLHIHGAGGADVLDATPEALRAMSTTLARLGTTGFVATTVAQPASGNRHIAVAAEHAGADLGGARLLGVYVEGPFISLAKRGGIQPHSILPVSREALDGILDLADGALRMMTVAPELPGALEAVERLVARGVVAAFGHSSAGYEETRAGLAAGMTHATHLFNAMAGLHHRAPGPIPALLEADGVTVELISDDVHVDRRMVDVAARLFGAERCNLITDGMRTVGLPEGRYEYGGREFESRAGAARYLDGTLIGTSIPLLEIARRFAEFTGRSFADAVDAATALPARVLGIADRVGSLEPGKDADLVLLDADLSVWATLVGGKVVYRR